MKYSYSISLLFALIIGQCLHAQTWNYVGTADFTPSDAFYESMALNAAGTPYMAFQDAASASKASVMKYDGSAWVNVGSPGFSAAEADYISLAIDGSGTPYVAYEDFGNSNKATVMKYDGSAWVPVGSAGFSAGTAGDVHLAIDGGGTPYVAFSDGANGSRATVMKYNGSSWVTTGIAGFTAGAAGFISLALDGSGHPCIAYEDGGHSNHASVMKYDGSSWANIGSAGFSGGPVQFVSLALDAGGTPYVVFQETVVTSGSGVAMKYDGSSWVLLGSPIGFTPGIGQWLAISIGTDGNPFVVFADGGLSSSGEAMHYNGSTWSVAGNVLYLTEVSYTSVAFDASGTPYWGFMDDDEKATVVRLGPAAISAADTVLCPGDTVTFHNATTGGSWAGSSVAVATVDSATGFAAAVAAGTVLISYTTTGGRVTRSITVNPGPAAGAVTGADSLCAGAATIASTTGSGGTWSSGAAGIAAVSPTGVVTGVAAGTANISYTATNGCGTATAVHTLTVNPIPSAGTVTGPDSVCAGNSVLLANTVTGGSWSSSNPAIATIDATGMAHGIAVGTAVVTYMVTDVLGCSAAAARLFKVVACIDGISGPDNNTAALTIIPNPASDAIIITSQEKIKLVSITNMLGVELFSHTYDTSNLQINISMLPPGVYLVRINGAITRRMVKQ